MPTAYLKRNGGTPVEVVFVKTSKDVAEVQVEREMSSVSWYVGLDEVFVKPN